MTTALGKLPPIVRWLALTNLVWCISGFIFLDEIGLLRVFAVVGAVFVFCIWWVPYLNYHDTKKLESWYDSERGP